MFAPSLSSLILCFCYSLILLKNIVILLKNDLQLSRSLFLKEEKFRETLNPFFHISAEDIAEMQDEVEDIMDDVGDTNDSENNNGEDSEKEEDDDDDSEKEDGQDGESSSRSARRQRPRQDDDSDGDEGKRLRVIYRKLLNNHIITIIKQIICLLVSSIGQKRLKIINFNYQLTMS